MHQGPTAALTLNEHVDYFGRTVREASGLLELAQPRELLVSEAVALEAGVIPLISARAGLASIVERNGIACQRISLVPDASEAATIQAGKPA